MYTIKLKFPKSGGYRQAYTNNDIEAFKGEELFDNLVREIVQNALDAKKKDSVEPVRVVFALKYIEKNSYDVFSQYDKCLKGCRNFWGESADAKLLRFLNEADMIIEKDRIPFFVASDYNTKGLVGSRNGKLNDPWEALTNEDGVSAGKSEGSGGSYGIGKNAPFACSGLSMVFYNTFATDGQKAFTGVAKLATLYDENGCESQRIGKFQKYDEQEEKWEPVYGDDNCPLRDLFARDEMGTDVIVAGFNQVNNWIENVKKAVIKHFFVAVKEGNLIVEVKGDGAEYLINAGTLDEYLSGYADDATMAVTIQLYKALTKPDKIVSLNILDKDDADVELYIKSEPSFSRTIANFRSTGMLVGQKSRRIFQHYAAVVIVRNDKLGGLLKDTEPPRHNRWDYKLITGEEFKERRKLAKQCIEKIDELVLNELKKQFEVKTEDSTDAEGVGDYLPDDVDGIGGAGTGDDALRVKIKIGKIRVVKERKEFTEVDGKKEKGIPIEGEVHNRDDNPDPQPGPHPPKPIIPDEESDYEGAKKATGKKNLTLPVMLAQRVFPVNISQGLYKIVLVPKNTSENLYISCYAIGEDGRVDYANVESVKKDGLSVNINKSNFGPVRVEKGIPATFFVRFKAREKMTLNLAMQEVNL